MSVVTDSGCSGGGFCTTREVRMGCFSSKSAQHVGEIGQLDVVTFDRQYTKGKDLGSGAYAVVYECHNKQSGRKAAVKVVDRTKLTQEDEAALQEEVAILRNMRHPHIVRLYDFFEEPKLYYIVMEICEGGELFDRIVEKKSYNEKEARDLVRILFDALHYCHRSNVVHRDLKPENLLLENDRDDANIKLADFGFAQRLEVPNSLTTQCGTPGYVAPEILKGQPYGESVDIWSAGVITYILLGGYPPFYDENQARMFRKIRRGEFKFHSPMWDHVSDEAKDLIRKLLVVDPTQRVTAQQALEHTWVLTRDEVLVGRDLTATVEEMKKFNARRKFKAAAGAVMLMHRLKAMRTTDSTVDEMDNSTSDPASPSKQTSLSTAETTNPSGSNATHTTEPAAAGGPRMAELDSAPNTETELTPLTRSNEDVAPITQAS